MKLRTALLAVALATAPVMTQSATVDPAEPPVTPAGGSPQAGLTAGTVVGVAIGVGILVAIAAGDDDDAAAPATATGTGTGTF